MKIKLTTKIFFSLLAIAGGLLLVRVILSAAFSADGITLGSITNKLAVLEKQNILLKEELYKDSSLTSISQSAVALGYVEEKSQLTISEASPLAIKQ